MRRCRARRRADRLQRAPRIRNYGVHAGPEKDELERWFTEESCGLLVLEAHTHLARLAGAVEQAIEQGPPGAAARR